MKSVKEQIGATMIRMGVAAYFSDGDETAVKVSLRHVQEARRQLADVEARLQTILRTGQ